MASVTADITYSRVPRTWSDWSQMALFLRHRHIPNVQYALAPLNNKSISFLEA